MTDFKKNRKKYIRGLVKALDAIGTTLGPNGRLVLDRKTNRLTKDGASVAQMLMEDIDTEEAPFLRMVTSSLWRVAADTGDGTTTASLILRSLLTDRWKEKEILSLERELAQRKGVKDWKGEYLIPYVRTTCNNNSEIMGVFQTYGDLPVLVRPVIGMETTSRLFSGYSWDSTHINDAWREVTVYDPKVWVGDIFTLESVMTLLESLGWSEDGGQNVVIVGQMAVEPLAYCIHNSYRDGRMKTTGVIVVVPPPPYPEDLKLYIRERGVRKISVSKGTIIVEPKNEEAEVELEAPSSMANIIEWEKRKALVSGKFVRVDVGGTSNENVMVNMAAWDDVVKSLKAAKKGGVVPGGARYYGFLSPKLEFLHKRTLGPNYREDALDAFLVVERAVKTAISLYRTIGNIEVIV